MRPHPSKKAFTLIELLMVIGLIVILWAMLLPAITNPSGKHATLPWCMSNQKQILIGFALWQNDHQGSFPWQVSSTNNGTMEPADQGYCLPNFDALASMNSQNAITLRVFVCPTDPTKTAATNWAKLTDQNLSYFVGIDGGTNAASVILTGDRHLEMGGKPVKPGLFAYSTNLDMNWSRELHKTLPSPTGAMGFLDGHVQVVRNKDLNAIFRNQGLISGRYDVP